MLEIKNLNIIKKNDERFLVRNFTFSIQDGDKVAIIGEEGNGKTTLLKAIYNDSLIKDFCLIEGSIIKNGIIGYLEQNLDKNWNNHTISEFYIKDNPKDEVDYNKYNDLAIFYSKLSKLNFDSRLIDEDQIISNLSGGEKVKLQIAKILCLSPDLLLLDEPTNDLDLETLKWLEEFIVSLNIPVIFVSHDETLLENTANVIIHLEQIKRKQDFRYTIERIGYKEYVKKRFNLLEKQEQVARKQKSDYEKQMEQFRQVFNKVEYQQDTITRADPHGAQLLKKKMKSLKSQEKRYEREKEEFLDVPDVEERINFKFEDDIRIPNGKKVLSLEVKELKVEDKLLSSNIKLDVTGPEHIVIIGNNGSGKTTLFKHIYDITKDRTDIKLGYMPQNYESLLNEDDNVLNILVNSGEKDEITKVRTLLGSMKFTSEESTGKIKELSGGQKAKLLLLKLMIDKCNVLLLDEPTRNLSPLSNPLIRDVLSKFTGAIISVSHDRKYIETVCDTVYKLDENGLNKIDYYNISNNEGIKKSI